MRNRLERQYPTPKNLKTRLIAQSSLQNFDDSIVSIFSVFFLSWKLRIASSVTTPQSWNHHDQQQSAQKKPLAISGHRKTGTGTSPSFLWQQSSIVYGLFPVWPVIGPSLIFRSMGKSAWSTKRRPEAAWRRLSSRTHFRITIQRRKDVISVWSQTYHNLSKKSL